MALTHCPACGREVSSEARACPGCGHPLGGEAPSKRAAFRTGSIIGLIGGASFTLVMALLMSGSFNAPRDGSADVSATVESSADVVVGLVGFLCCAAVTVLFILALAMANRLSRKAAVGISATALALSGVALIGIVLYYNVLMICMGWLFLWEPALEVIGSIKMLSAALKIKDA